MRILKVKYWFGWKDLTVHPFGAIVLEKDIDNNVVMNHVNIHWIQQKELGLKFYPMWIYERLTKGYDNISFEKEANANEKNLEYLATRPANNWRNYR